MFHIICIYVPAIILGIVVAMDARINPHALGRYKSVDPYLIGQDNKSEFILHSEDRKVSEEFINSCIAGVKAENRGIEENLSEEDKKSLVTRD